MIDIATKSITQHIDLLIQAVREHDQHRREEFDWFRGYCLVNQPALGMDAEEFSKMRQSYSPSPSPSPRMESPAPKDGRGKKK